MALETVQPTPVPDASAPPSRVKFRVRFRKAGDLRLVSHHDLMHVFERTFRRADLTLAITQGFNPRPKMAFALSLALGVAGLKEVLEIELTETLAADELHRRLAAHCPPGIDILSVQSIDFRTKAHVRRTWYRLPIPSDMGASGTAEELQTRIACFLAQPEVWFERTRPQRKRVNLRAFVSELHLRDHGIEIALWISPKGAARPEEVVAALGLAAWLDAGAVMERTDLEISDELPPGTEGPPALEHALEESQASDSDRPEEAGASRPTAIISNPLSFET